LVVFLVFRLVGVTQRFPPLARFCFGLRTASVGFFFFFFVDFGFFVSVVVVVVIIIIVLL
jgi:hypothetical protein